MSYDVNNIIRITARLSSAGLAYANFGKAVLFAPEAEKPVGSSVDTFAVYTKLEDLAEDYASTTETYKAASRWFSMLPKPRELTVYIRSNVTDSDTVVATLTKAADVLWWYWTFFTKDVYADEANIPGIAVWADANGRMVPNCSTAAGIRDPLVTNDIASTLTTAGSRHIYTLSHATDDYAGIALAAHFATVNYAQTNSTITGEFKKLPGIPAEDLSGTAYATMNSAAKKAVFYTKTELQGSVDNGRVINSTTHSTYGEYIDDVVNLDAFINDVKVSVYNALTGQTTKAPQTPIGQAILLSAAEESCQRYVANGFLGPRTYTNPDNGLDEYSPGYVILSKPEDILTLSDADRAARKSAPIRIRVHRAGAIHGVDIDIDIY